MRTLAGPRQLPEEAPPLPPARHAWPAPPRAVAVAFLRFILQTPILYFNLRDTCNFGQPPAAYVITHMYAPTPRPPLFMAPLEQVRFRAHRIHAQATHSMP